MPYIQEGKTIKAVSESSLGEGRYSMELWVGSHPTIRPCEVSQTPDIYYWLDGDRATALAEFNFSMVGTRPDFHRKSLFPLTDLGDNVTRLMKYDFLGGYIMRWDNLYDEQPPSDSWFWSYYPDGPEWKKGIELYGASQVYDKLTRPHWPKRMFRRFLA